jgi:hypothetical protein
MANYQIEGNLHQIMAAKQISEKFTVQEFVLHFPGNYPQYIKFQASNKALQYLKPDMVGTSVKITFDIRGREHNGNFYNNLNAWKIESIGQLPVTNSFSDDGVENPF